MLELSPMSVERKTEINQDGVGFQMKTVEAEFFNSEHEAQKKISRRIGRRLALATTETAITVGAISSIVLETAPRHQSGKIAAIEAGLGLIIGFAYPDAIRNTAAASRLSVQNDRIKGFIKSKKQHQYAPR
jgi:hypothetical protein